jgi:hypothetical protein
MTLCDSNTSLDKHKIEIFNVVFHYFFLKYVQGFILLNELRYLIWTKKEKKSRGQKLCKVKHEKIEK